MKKLMIGAALLALAAGEVQAQTPPQAPEAGRGGGFRSGGGGFRSSGGGERPGFGAGVRPNFERPAFSGPQRPDFGSSRPGFERRGFPGGAQQGATPSAPAGSGQPAFRRWGEGGGFQGRRFGGDAPVQTAPTPGAAPQAQPGQAFGGDRLQGRRFQDGGRFDGRRFGGDEGRRSDGRAYGGQGFAGQGFQPRGYVGGQRFGGGEGYRGGRAFSYRGRSYGAFRAAPYRYPRGYGYRRYALRSYLPLALLSSTWFLNDYGSYYLAPPPSAQFRWVRYGPDALLVDSYTGQVVDAAYGVFDEGGGYDYYGEFPDGPDEGGDYPPPCGPY